MARKEKHYAVTDDGRDKCKVFLLTEMACERAEKWALRALSAAAKAGVDIGEAPTGGMAAIATMGIEALFRVDFAEAEPLLDELFGCVKIIRMPDKPDMAFDLMEEDIEEVRTRLRLRLEVLRLHVGFSPGAAPSTSTSGPTPNHPASSNTPTSHPSSGKRSHIRRQR